MDVSKVVNLVETKFAWVTRIFKNDAQGLLACVFFLIVLGSINIFSATFVMDELNGQNMGYHFFRHMFSLALAIIISFLVYRIDYHKYQNYKFQQIIIFVILFLLVAVFAFGDVVNGARRWIQVPVIGNSVQPSEFAKLGAILWSANEVSRRLNRLKPIEWLGEDKSIKGTIGKCIPTRALWMPVLYSGFVILQPDMGTAVLITGFAMLIMFYAGAKVNLKVIGGVLLIAFIFVFMSPYRWERVVSWWNPWKYQQTLGYQTTQGLMAVGSGGIWGQGVGQGSSKYLYLPEAHTDFAFAVFSQEWGLIGALLIIVIILAFTYYGLHISFHARDNFGKLLAAGITMLISIQAVFNMLMVCGVMPVTGVPLPFISYGGSSLMLNCAAVSILVNISKKSTVGHKKIGIHGEVPSLREETQSRFQPQSRIEK